MPGRTSYEAAEGFLIPLRDTISCVAQTKINVSPGGMSDQGRVHQLYLNRDEPVPLRLERRIGHIQTLHLYVRMRYEIIPCEDQERCRYRVTTRAYDFQVQLSSGEIIVAFHWHPEGASVATPHLHVGRTQLVPHGVISARSHLPTGRVSLESVVRICITELHARALQDDWDKRLDRREADFTSHRTWH